MTEPQATILVVSHTHWDREWYKTAEQFRVGLVSLVDQLLETEGPFVLDGQANVLDDYLAWQPERAGALRARLQRGEIEAGPWYVLADNLIPSGEALIRNLLLGRETLESLGATAPRVLYCPDSFGHPASGPTLAAGFALPLAIVWRGYGGREWPAGDAARWRSTGGDEIQLYHLPPSGYEHGSNLPFAAKEAWARWTEIAATLGSRAAGRTQLLLNGADHHAPQPALDDAIALGRSVFPGATIRRARLTEFVSARVGEGASRRLPVVIGELRRSPDYVWALQGTFGSRAAQKRENARVERAIVRDLEPWQALAWWQHGTDTAPAARALWRMVLEGHPHDTLCGCAIDGVAEAMDQRLRAANALIEELRQRALQATAGIEHSAGRAAFASNDRALLLRNASMFPRGGVAAVSVELPLAPVPVGPGSCRPPITPHATGPVTIGTEPLCTQTLSVERAFARFDAPRDYPRQVLVERRRMLVWVDEVAASGVQALPILYRRSRKSVPHPVRVRDGILENGNLAVRYDEKAGLCVTAGVLELSDLLRLESMGDGGDLYTPSPAPDTRRTGRVVRSRVTLRGPLRAELTLSCVVPVAARQVTTALGEVDVRAEGTARLEVRVQLDAGAQWVRVTVVGDNPHANVTVRAVFRTGCAAPTHLADATFGPVRRISGAPAVRTGDVETITAVAPLHRYASLFDRARGYGVTVLSDGLAEYEAAPHGDVSITLFRAVGDLSRATLPERPGHAGWPAATPGAQAPGPFQAVFAVFPHGLDTAHVRGAIERVADEVLLPMQGTTLVPVNLSEAGPRLEGDGLGGRACKRSQDGERLVVRCVNITAQVRRGSWRLSGLAHAWLARLDETALGALPVRDNRVWFEVPPHAVSTILLRRAIS